MLGVVISICIYLLSAHNGVRGEKLNFRIIDGQLADIKEFPYQVSIMLNNSHHCGGSIISPQYILTAAHCAYHIPAEYFKVRVGSNTIDEGGEVHQVVKTFVHPAFTSKFEYDIAVMKLETPLQYNNKVQPIELPKFNQRLPPQGTLALVTGWGRTNATVDEMSKHLISMEVPLLPHRVCKQLYSNKKYTVDSRMFCAGIVKGGRDSCLGDSGGAIAIDGVQYGIVSWGVGCALPDKPGVYASVPRLRRYILYNSGV